MGMNNARATAKKGIPPLRWIQWSVRNRESIWLARSVIVMIRKAFLITVMGKTVHARTT